MRRAVASLAVWLSVAAPLPASAQPRPWSWPVSGRILTRFHVAFDPYAGGQHRGVDIAASVGTPVRAACAGRVRFAGTLPDGTGAVSVACGELTATYLQVRGPLVRVGARVVAGSHLAAVAPSRDRREPRAHLYLGARVDGSPPRYRDPLALLGYPRPPPLVPFQRPPPARRPAPPPSQAPPAPGPSVEPRSPGTNEHPAPARVPVLAWLGLALGAAGMPSGALLRRRSRERARRGQVLRSTS